MSTKNIILLLFLFSYCSQGEDASPSPSPSSCISVSSDSDHEGTATIYRDGKDIGSIEVKNGVGRTNTSSVSVGDYVSITLIGEAKSAPGKKETLGKASGTIEGEGCSDFTLSLDINTPNP